MAKVRSGAEKWVDTANKRLKGLRASLEVSGGGNTLHLRGTFPPKPWESNQKTRQRKISLKRRAGAEVDVKAAEKLARQIDLDLNNNEFDWTQFPGIVDPRIAEPTTVAEWVQMLEADRRHTMSDLTWHRNYELLLPTLPMESELNEGVLIDWILSENSAGNTMRPKYVAIAAGLLEVAGLDATRIRKLRREVSTKPVNPRDLPEDEAIVAMWKSIAYIKPEWAWVYAMLATYGLRPHEIFRLDLSLFPKVRVLQNSKTGERIIPAIRPHWVQEFELTDKIRLPQNLQWEPEQPHAILGRKIGGGFIKHKLGDPYSLRHCYARECLRIGLSSDVGAKLMGHSREIHERTYRAFIKSSVYIEAAERAIERAGIS
jgi:integrase